MVFESASIVTSRASLHPDQPKHLSLSRFSFKVVGNDALAHLTI